MADITTAIEQDQIANSLLSESDQQGLEAEQQGGDFDRSLAGVVDQGQYEEQFSEEQEDGLDELREFVQEREESLEPQQEQEQPQEPTAQEIRESVQQLETQAAELGLGDPQETADLASALGLDPANTAALGSWSAKTDLSAYECWRQCGGDLTNVPPISHHAAVIHANEVCRFMGVDPRLAQVDAVNLADTILFAKMNVLNTIAEYGLDAPPDMINDPEQALLTLQTLSQCFGSNYPWTRKEAVEIADAFVRPMLGNLRKIVAQQPQPRTSSGSSRGRQRASSSRFRSNQDLFDDEAEALYRQEHGRL